MLEKGVVEVLQSVLRRHEGNAAVVEEACGALRNIANTGARCGVVLCTRSLVALVAMASAITMRECCACAVLCDLTCGRGGRPSLGSFLICA